MKFKYSDHVRGNELMKKKHNIGLSKREEKELKKLKQKHEDWIDQNYPMSKENKETIKKITGSEFFRVSSV